MTAFRNCPDYEPEADELARLRTQWSELVARVDAGVAAVSAPSVDGAQSVCAQVDAIVDLAVAGSVVPRSGGAFLARDVDAVIADLMPVAATCSRARAAHGLLSSALALLHAAAASLREDDEAEGT